MVINLELCHKTNRLHRGGPGMRIFRSWCLVGQVLCIMIVTHLLDQDSSPKRVLEKILTACSRLAALESTGIPGSRGMNRADVSR